MLETVYQKLPRQVESLDDTGTTYPLNPVEGMFYWDETDESLYRFSSKAGLFGAWVCIS